MGYFQTSHRTSDVFFPTSGCFKHGRTRENSSFHAKNTSPSHLTTFPVRFKNKRFKKKPLLLLFYILLILFYFFKDGWLHSCAARPDSQYQARPEPRSKPNPPSLTPPLPPSTKSRWLFLRRQPAPVSGPGEETSHSLPSIIGRAAGRNRLEWGETEERLTAGVWPLSNV